MENVIQNKIRILITVFILLLSCDNDVNKDVNKDDIWIELLEDQNTCVIDTNYCNMRDSDFIYDSKKTIFDKAILNFKDNLINMKFNSIFFTDENGYSYSKMADCYSYDSRIVDTAFTINIYGTEYEEQRLIFSKNYGILLIWVYGKYHVFRKQYIKIDDEFLNISNTNFYGDLEDTLNYKSAIRPISY
ncbi:hypothetical protein KAH27_06805 [bacterium]|nr:hypothetical protein [bacterium]